MNCSAPMPANDPFLPAQNAPTGPCPDCGLEHRLDLGCPTSELAGMRLVVLVLFLAVCFVGAAVVCVGAIR